MALWEMNKILGTPQPSGEYHHLELRGIELPQNGKSFGKLQWDPTENDQE